MPDLAGRGQLGGPGLREMAPRGDYRARQEELARVNRRGPVLAVTLSSPGPLS